MKVAELLLNYLPRIEAAAAELDDARTREKAATERRDRLIVDAVDAGVSQRAVARAARLGHPNIIRILSKPPTHDNDADDDDDS